MGCSAICGRRKKPEQFDRSFQPRETFRMSNGQIFFAVLAVVLAVLGLLWRTSPDEAGSKTREWIGWIKARRLKAGYIGIVIILIGLGIWVVQSDSSTRQPLVTTIDPPLPKVIKDSASEAPPIPYTDDAVHGWLKPANFPTPPNGCDGIVDANAIKILIGDNGIALDGDGKIVALQIGSCEALSIERSSDRVLVSATLNDGSGVPPVTIKNNEIFAQNGETYSARQTRDSSSITIKDKLDHLILEAKFLNKTTLKVRGKFGCVGGRSVDVKDDQPIPSFFMSRSCIANARVGIAVGE